MPALFPMRRPAMAGMPPAKQPDQYDPTGIGQRRRPGLFGRLGKVNWSDVLQTLGSGLQQMDGGTELSDYTAARDDQMLRRDMFGRQVRSDKMEEAQAQQARQQQQDALAAMAEGLTPQQQAAALLNPDAAAAAQFRPPPARWSEPFNLGGAQVQRNEATGEMRSVVPRAPVGGAGGAGGAVPQLRGADARQLSRIQTSAESARGLRALVDEFDANLSNQDTFPGSGVQVWDPEVRSMTALAARMTGLMRPVGSGATSDFEQRLYARGAPSVDNTREANRQIIEGLRRLSDISDARQQFYEQYAMERGSLLGAEQAFQASPGFQGLTDRAGGSGNDELPEGVSREEWNAMTPEERALWQ